MTSDRTQHVIDAIDGALADDEFPDAMRWSPEPEVVDAPAPFDGSLVWQPPQRYELGALQRHVLTPDLEIVDETSTWRATWAEPALLSPEEVADLQQRMRSRSLWLLPERVTVAPYQERSRAEDEWTIRRQRQWGQSPAPSAIQFAPFSPDPTQVAAISEQLGQAVAALTEWAERAAELVGMTLTEWQRNVLEVALADSRPMAPEAPQLEDPRARALRLRQERSTGPSRDLTRQRRPRQLP